MTTPPDSTLCAGRHRRPGLGDRCIFSGRTPTQQPSLQATRRRAGGSDQRVPVHVAPATSLAGRPVTVARDQVGLAEEVGDERGGRALVQLGRGAQLLDPARVHHRDGVGHRHGLLLVVRDVHEGDADLGLDPLELDLHLAAQLEVEGAERLVEQQHLRAG